MPFLGGYNIAPSLTCIKSKLCDYTALGARTATSKKACFFHTLAFMRPSIAIEASLVAGFRHTYGLLALQLERP